MIDSKLLMYIDEFHQDEKEQVFLFLLGLRHPVIKYNAIISPNAIFKLIKDGIIEKNFITSDFNLLVNFYETDDGNIITSGYKSISNEIREHIDDYRSLFKGVRIGSMGDKETCITKMINFIITHNTTLDKVIEATMYYLERENPEYIMNADNFISNEKGSKLAIVMDDVPKSRLL